MVLWGARVFETGLLIALPAVIALVIVNLALGVVTRAAPQLNLFGIGFTITLMSRILRAASSASTASWSGISSLIDSALAGGRGTGRRARRGGALMAAKPKRAANAPKNHRNDACKKRASAARYRARASSPTSPP